MASSTRWTTAIARTAFLLLCLFLFLAAATVDVTAGDLDGVGGLRFKVEDQGGGGISSGSSGGDPHSWRDEVILPPNNTGVGPKMRTPVHHKYAAQWWWRGIVLQLRLSLIR